MSQGLPAAIRRPPVVLIVMGVSGSGKTTVGQALAEQLGCAFEDADRFHPAENIVKMSHGEPLSDADRWPWLDAVRNFIREHVEKGERTIITCSALTACYRQRLVPAASPNAVRFAYLRITKEEAQRRMNHRQHFMPALLLESQFAALEEPTDAQWLNAQASPNELVRSILAFSYN